MDKLNSYRKPTKSFCPKTDHRSHKDLNIQAENSHQSIREKEQQMRKFHHPQRAQFSWSFAQILSAYHLHILNSLNLKSPLYDVTSIGKISLSMCTSLD